MDGNYLLSILSGAASIDVIEGVYMTLLSREQTIDSLQRFKRLRDAALHEDVDQFEHHLERVVNFLKTDPFVSQTLNEMLQVSQVDIENWWQHLEEAAAQRRGIAGVWFPEDSNDEQAMRFLIMEQIVENERKLFDFGFKIGVHKLQPAKEHFRSVVARPFFEELSDRLGKAAGLASPEARALQAVPFDRLPSENEVKIFLSHKTADKPLVRRFHRALVELGFQPWLDEPDMPAGRDLERSILQGFEDSCAAVFFITENFVDEKYLATEVNYAIRQKRKKGEKFAIITLVFSQDYEIPGLLETYVYKVVQHELDGLYELIRALPIELGPVRWKEAVVHI